MPGSAQTVAGRLRFLTNLLRLLPPRPFSPGAKVASPHPRPRRLCPHGVPASRHPDPRLASLEAHSTRPPMGLLPLFAHNWAIKRAVRLKVEDALAAYAHGRLIDIGCGDKPYARFLRGRVTEHFGIDLADGPLGTAALDRIGTAYETHEPDASADTVLHTQVLEHSEEPADAVQESMRILRPGGHLVLSTDFAWHLHAPPPGLLPVQPVRTALPLRAGRFPGAHGEIRDRRLVPDLPGGGPCRSPGCSTQRHIATARAAPHSPAPIARRSLRSPALRRPDRDRLAHCGPQAGGSRSARRGTRGADCRLANAA